MVSALTALLLAACGSKQSPEQPPVEQAAPAVSAPAPVPDPRPVIVAFGNSLSAGYGVSPGQSYPDYLQQALDKAGHKYRVANAGISGDTTSGGLERIHTITAMKPAMVILELGGNDGLRGLPILATRDNLDQMIKVLKDSGIQVVLAGMTLPPNYGPDYISQFEKVYKDLAARHKIALIPFLLEGVADQRRLMQSDGIHPTAEGNRITAENVFRVIAPLLAR